MYNVHTHADVEARRIQESEGAGGVAQYVRSVVRGEPTGTIHSTNAKPGPLDGQPEHRWFTDVYYSDGSKRTFGVGYNDEGLPLHS